MFANENRYLRSGPSGESGSGLIGTWQDENRPPVYFFGVCLTLPTHFVDDLYSVPPAGNGRGGGEAERRIYTSLKRVASDSRGSI